MNNLPILVAISALIISAVVCIFAGLRRLYKARSQGLVVVWYKQISMLFGIEFMLLGLVLVINLGSLSKFFPHSLDGLILVIISVLSIAVVGLVVLIVGLYVLSVLKRDQQGFMDGL